jgi:hypothetical protein
MKKILYSILLAGLFSCEKEIPEQKIDFTIDALNNSISTGSNFPVNITLVSTMPTQGIKIGSIAVNQITNSTLPQASPFSSKITKNTLLISNLPQQQWCNVTITVTSNNNISNTSSKSFTVIYK